MASEFFTVAIGYAGRDAEYKDVGTGMAKFSLACTESWKDKNTGEWQEKTTWVSCIIWGSGAQRAVEKIKKGDHVYVKGMIELNEWTNKEGEAKAALQLKAHRWMVLGRQEPRPAAQVSPPSADDSGLPF